MRLTDLVQIRPAEPADVELIFSLIVELAEYERAPEQVRGSPQLLNEALFGAHPSAEALIAELDGESVGFALFYTTFSTWQCQPGIWLEDLYVPPAKRRGGIGRALLVALAAIAVQRGYPRLEWTVLRWNEPALGLYERLGAKPLEEWLTHRLDGPLLAAVAAEADGTAVARDARCAKGMT